MRILIVDDEEGLREFIADALADDGHDTTTAGDGLSALAQLHERAFDVMITDLRMPGALDGVDVLRKAKAEQPDIEVIVLTAHATVDTAVEAMKLGAFDYLEKPVSSPSQTDVPSPSSGPSSPHVSSPCRCRSANGRRDATLARLAP